MENRLSNEQAELAVISALMWHGCGRFVDETDGLTSACFTSVKCAYIYDALSEMASKGESFQDYLSISGHILKDKGVDIPITDILEIAVNDNAYIDLQKHVATLIELEARRRMLAALDKVHASVCDLSQPFDEALTDASNSVNGAMQNAYTHAVTGRDVVKEIYDRINCNLVDSRTGYHTGFSRFDQYGGLHPSDLVIVAADSSQGKTALAATIAYNSASSGVPVAVYSMEMSRTQIVARMAAPASGVSSNDIMFKPLNGEQINKVDAGFAKMDEALSNIYFDDKSINGMPSIVSSIRTLHARHGVKEVILDYLQIINLDTKNSTQERAVANAARTFKNLAKELGICIVVLSQLNRDRGINNNPEPTAARLRDSGQINEAADLTMLVYRPSAYIGENLHYPSPYENVSVEGTAMIKVAKDRNGGYGGVGSFIVGFDSATTHFYELDTLPQRTLPSPGAIAKECWSTPF